MIYANKKVNQNHNLAQQTAKIIANVNALMEKDLVKLTADTIYLDCSLWKDKATASNWINCIQIYYIVKRGLKKSHPLCFRDIHTEDVIGTLTNSKPKVLLFGKES